MSSAAVEAILAARRDRLVLAPLGAAAPVDVAAGYALQRAVAERLGAVPPAGFKIGATTQRMQAYLGLPGPAAGFVPAASLNPTGTTFEFASFQKPGVECEIAVRLGADLAPRATTAAEAAAAVAEVFPAIEIVENRYGDLAALGTPTVIADQVFHASGVLGAAAPGWRAMDLGALRGRFLIDGAEVAAGHGRDLLGHPMAALAWLAGSGAAAAFGGLRAGQVVWLGSVTLPVWLAAPCTVAADFGALGVATLRFV